VVTTTQATMVGTKEVSQTLNEGTKQTTQSNSLNIEDQKWVHIEKKLNLRTPLLNVSAFGTLQWITEERWPVLLKKKENEK
jgi:hypothetical protein